jgi:NADH-quinone oxidoreductase subunit M
MLLFSTLILQIIGIFLLVVTPSDKQKTLKLIALGCSYLTYIDSLYLWIISLKDRGKALQIVKTKDFSFEILNSNITLDINDIALCLLILTITLCGLCFLVGWNSKHHNLKVYFIVFLSLELFLIVVFCVLEFFFFYQSYSIIFNVVQS